MNGTEKVRIKSDGRISIGDSTTPMTAAAITSNYLQATTGQAMVGIVFSNFKLLTQMIRK